MTRAVFAALAIVISASVLVSVACDGEVRLRSTLVDVDAALVDGPDDGADANASDGTANEASHGCGGDVQCLHGLHCESVSKSCVECIVDAHCNGERPRCDVALHRCVECGSSLDCNENETCEATTRRCVVDCLDGGVCPSHTPICSQRGLCVACVNDVDCAASPTTPVCDVALGQCSECTDDSRCTGTSALCDPVKLTCVECTESVECSGQCDPVTGHCVD